MTSPSPLRVVVLISGLGSNLRALVRAQKDDELQCEICAVFSDRQDAPGLEIARQAGVPTRFANPSACADKAAFDAALTRDVLEFDPQLVVLAGYMRILGPIFVTTFQDRMLNIHPSLLPRFRGLATHRRVLEAGDSHHGATVHFVTEKLDGGPPVIQYRIPVLPQDDETTLKSRISRGEHVILPRAVGWFVAQRLRLANGAVMLDGRQLNQPIVVEGEA